MTDYRLKAVYFPGKGTRLGYRKAMVYEDEVQFFLDLGALPTQEDALNASADPVGADVVGSSSEESFDFMEEGDEDEEVDGDKGTGKPGSLQWHEAKIRELRYKTGIMGYAKQVTGKTLRFDGKTKVSELKAQALALIKEGLANDDDS